VKTGCRARSDMIYENQNSISQLKMSSPILSLLLSLLLPNLLLAKTCCDEPQSGCFPARCEEDCSYKPCQHASCNGQMDQMCCSDLTQNPLDFMSCTHPAMGTALVRCGVSTSKGKGSLISAGPRVGQGLPLSRTARASSRLGRLRLKMRELARK